MRLIYWVEFEAEGHYWTQSYWLMFAGKREVPEDFTLCSHSRSEIESATLHMRHSGIELKTKMPFCMAACNSRSFCINSDIFGTDLRKSTQQIHRTLHYRCEIERKKSEECTCTSAFWKMMKMAEKNCRINIHSVLPEIVLELTMAWTKTTRNSPFPEDDEQNVPIKRFSSTTRKIDWESSEEKKV